MCLSKEIKTLEDFKAKLAEENEKGTPVTVEYTLLEERGYTSFQKMCVTPEFEATYLQYKTRKYYFSLYSYFLFFSNEQILSEYRLSQENNPIIKRNLKEDKKEKIKKIA